jgi:predicted RNA-binding Zn-ribbon protein involved in translation (DUF1610 family)
MKPMCIYIASKLSASTPIEYLKNLRESIKAAAKVWRRGHYPYVPGLDFMVYLELNGDYGNGHEQPYDCGVEWVKRCDALLLVNGYDESENVRKEFLTAEENDKIIFYSVDEIPSVNSKCPDCGKDIEISIEKSWRGTYHRRAHCSSCGFFFHRGDYAFTTIRGKKVE